MCSVMGYIGQQFSYDDFKDGLLKTRTRGPDDTRIVMLPVGGTGTGAIRDSGKGPDGNGALAAEADGEIKGFLGFNRLSIMGLTPSGMQPFRLGNDYISCNGEIYGFRSIKDDLIKKGYSFESDSDCEILLPLYREYGTDMFVMLDAEFALILYDSESGKLIAARDPIGIRPLYYGYDSSGSAIFASEPKNLTGMVKKIMPFPPGHYYKDGEFFCYRDITYVKETVHDDLETVCKNIHDKLIEGVRKRLDSDSKVGFLLSGGLDSSLVCAIAARESRTPIKTFAIGMKADAIDLKYAKEAAEYIGSDHTEVVITPEDVLSTLRDLIYLLGTYDITTIRASMGMYLVCKAVHEQTDLRVILTGEISDELFGYKYTDFAPDAEEFQKEAVKRISEIHMYDVLRADRCISVNSLEARVPFGDLDFVEYVMAVDPELKLNRYNKGKYLLRHAFEKEDYLPESLLFREKAAFSDAVGHSLADLLKERAAELYSDEAYEEKRKRYSFATPFTKESLMYREIFEEFYEGQAEMVKDFWMPNREWEGCNVDDPSARVLSNYGASGD